MGNKVFEEDDLLPKSLMSKTQPLAAKLKPLNQFAPRQTQQTSSSPSGGGGFSFFPIPPHRTPYNQFDPNRAYETSRAGAPARQAWASGPTFRYFKRSQYFPEDYSYASVRDNRTGDNFYRPRSVEQERARAARIHRSFQRRPVRRGEW